MQVWNERARWEWTNPATGFLHEVWIKAAVDVQSHEIQSWGVWTRLGGPGKGPKTTYYPLSLHGPAAARDGAYEAARAYREKYAGPTD